MKGLEPVRRLGLFTLEEAYEGTMPLYDHLKEAFKEVGVFSPKQQVTG